MSAKDRQVAGGHYKGMAIQPIDYIAGNDLNWYQGNIVKYATRYPFKGCAVDDLRKIIHYAELALEAEMEEVSDKDYQLEKLDTAPPVRLKTHPLDGELG